MNNSYDVVIIGGGLSGLSAAHFIRKGQASHRLMILEKSSRPGGAIQTFKQAGFQGEWGPHGFLDNTEESQELLHDTGLYHEAQPAPLADFYRYVCHHGQLLPLPQSLKTVLTTPLVPPLGKLRVLADLWKKPRLEAMTIGEWVGYRFGKALLPLVDAAVTGSFAGDYTKLCIDAVMPGVRQLEKEAGSVLRGLIQKKKRGGKKLQRLPSMLNFPDGMERLIKVLSGEGKITYNTLVQGLSRTAGGWQVQTDQGVVHGSRLVVALPVNQCLQLLSPLQAPPITCVPVAKIINVVLGFPSSAQVPYGFGYLSPEREGRFTLGAMFTSHMFPDRAPKGNVLLEALVGGRRHPERLDLSDEEITSRVLADLSQLIPLPEAPILAKVLRPEHGIPQLEMDHPRLLDWRRDIERDLSGLHICGFGWDGIGMNDMIKSAKKTVLAMQTGANRVDEGAKVKPIYF